MPRPRRELLRVLKHASMPRARPCTLANAPHCSHISIACTALFAGWGHWRVMCVIMTAWRMRSMRNVHAQPRARLHGAMNLPAKFLPHLDTWHAHREPRAVLRTLLLLCTCTCASFSGMRGRSPRPFAHVIPSDSVCSSYTSSRAHGLTGLGGRHCHTCARTSRGCGGGAPDPCLHHAPRPKHRAHAFAWATALVINTINVFSAFSTALHCFGPRMQPHAVFCADSDAPGRGRSSARAGELCAVKVDGCSVEIDPTTGRTRPKLRLDALWTILRSLGPGVRGGRLPRRRWTQFKTSAQLFANVFWARATRPNLGRPPKQCV